MREWTGDRSPVDADQAPALEGQLRQAYEHGRRDERRDDENRLPHDAGGITGTVVTGAAGFPY